MAPPDAIKNTADTQKLTPLPAVSTSATAIAAITTIVATTAGTLRLRWWWIDSTATCVVTPVRARSAIGPP
ncbi:MAG TPA: hypothetical protein VLS53_07735 [Candidatus Dormibacteraeota bacterium]|nr:hypothetical protein [Candidatus Dormibacteraeota bacterium]